jgi:hypothetical protein
MNVTQEMMSEVSGELAKYLSINQLPSNFRSYDIKNVFVRGLYLEESDHLAKYIGGIGDASYSQLYAIYKDVIKGIDILKLELVDFIILMVISSIWTADNFGWSPNIPCVHTDENGDRCEGIITEKIILDEFDFKAPLITSLPVPLKIRDRDMLIGSLTLGDMIERENYLVEHPDASKKLLSYVSLIKNEDMTFEEKFRFIRFSVAKELADLAIIDSEIHITMELLPKKCPVCKKVNKLKIGLTEIRGYP